MNEIALLNLPAERPSRRRAVAPPESCIHRIAGIVGWFVAKGLAQRDTDNH